MSVSLITKPVQPHRIKRKRVKYMAAESLSQAPARSSPSDPSVQTETGPPSAFQNSVDIKILVTSPSQAQGDPSPLDTLKVNRSSRPLPKPAPKANSSFVLGQPTKTIPNGEKRVANTSVSTPKSNEPTLCDPLFVTVLDKPDRVLPRCQLLGNPRRCSRYISCDYKNFIDELKRQHVDPSNDAHRTSDAGSRKITRLLKKLRLLRSSPSKAPPSSRIARPPKSSNSSLSRHNLSSDSRTQALENSTTTHSLTASPSGIKLALHRTQELFTGIGMTRNSNAVRNNSISARCSETSGSDASSLCTSYVDRPNQKLPNSHTPPISSSAASLLVSSPPSDSTVMDEEDSNSDATAITDSDLSEQDFLIVWNERRARKFGSKASPITWEELETANRTYYGEVIDVFDGLLEGEGDRSSGLSFKLLDVLNGLDSQLADSLIWDELPTWEEDVSRKQTSMESDSWSSIEFQRLRSPSSRILSLLAGEPAFFLKDEIPLDFL